MALDESGEKKAANLWADSGADAWLPLPAHNASKTPSRSILGQPVTLKPTRKTHQSRQDTTPVTYCRHKRRIRPAPDFARFRPKAPPIKSGE